MSPFKYKLLISVNSGSDIMKSAPFTTVHGMDDGSSGMGPCFHPFGSNGIRGMPLPMSALLVIIGITGQDLLLSIDVQLVKIIILIQLRHPNMVVIPLPFCIDNLRAL